MWSDDDVVIVMLGDCGRRCGGCLPVLVFTTFSIDWSACLPRVDGICPQHF